MTFNEKMRSNACGPVGEDVDSPFYQLDSVCDALSAQSIAGLPDHHAGMIKPDYPARRHNRGTS